MELKKCVSRKVICEILYLNKLALIYSINHKKERLFSPGGFSGTGYKLNENGVLNTGSEANPTNAKILENSEVEVIVEWNDNTETIILTKN